MKTPTKLRLVVAMLSLLLVFVCIGFDYYFREHSGFVNTVHYLFANFLIVLAASVFVIIIVLIFSIIYNKLHRRK